MGRVVYERNAIGVETKSAYDAAGNIKKSVNGRKLETEYAYDDKGRLTGLKDAAGQIDYSYDANGNVTGIKETVNGKTQEIKKTYDALNRVTSYTDYKGNTVSYGYDEFGNMISLTYPGGKIVRYDYDKMGNIKEVYYDNSSTPEVSYTYDSRGRLTGISNANGTTETRTYNDASLITSIVCKDSNGKAVSSNSYTYNKFGEVTAIDSSTSEGGVAENETLNMAYNEVNQLKYYNGEEVTYDADGNMTYGPLDGKMAEFKYDARNRLIQAGNLTYEYDAENNRIAKTDSETGIRTDYVLNTAAAYVYVIQETKTKVSSESEETTPQSDTTSYIYAAGLVEERNEADTYFYHYNNIGSTTALTDSNGKLVDTYQYDTYGQIMDGDVAKSDFLYNGQYGVATDENGLYYMRARYYNVNIRRFINQDILYGNIQNSQSLNRYSYVQGNPVQLNDPFGLCPSGNSFLKNLGKFFIGYNNLKFGALTLNRDLEISGFVDMWESGSYIYNTIKENPHLVLDVLGCIPVVGILADIGNCILYAKEGDWKNATLCGMSGAAGLLSFGAASLATSSFKAARLACKISKAASVVDAATNIAILGNNAVALGDTIKDVYTKCAVEGKAISAADIGNIGLNVAGLFVGSRFVAKSLTKGSVCFAAGTLVTVKGGTKKIEDIQEGDFVLSENPETGEQEYKQVKRVFVHEKDEIVHVTISGEEIETTREHPFWVEGTGWVGAGDLKAGDVARLADGKAGIVESVTIEQLDEPIKVYNFEVEDFHTYYVAGIGVLVHNVCGITGGIGEAGKSDRRTDVTTGLGYDAGDNPVRIDGDWTINDMKQALLGHPPRGLGSPDIHHGGQMPGAAKHEVIPIEHRNNTALHPNKYNQGVTPEMRESDRQLHWWYRAREQGADELLSDWIYDD